MRVCIHVLMVEEFLLVEARVTSKAEEESELSIANRWACVNGI